MAIPRNSLGAFLKQAKASLKRAIDQKEKVTLVIGNESADLDSITSSIVYAYLRSITHSTRSPATLHIPLLNIPKADINLRPELLTLLPHANISQDHLITLDDLPGLDSIKETLAPELTRWFLVDHNALQGKLGAIYADRVVGVIDHHADENKVPKETGDEPRVINTSGSCTSLIINHCRETWDNLSTGTSSTGAAHAQGDSLMEDEAVTSLWDAQVAQLALASVLIDTINLQDEHKTTQHDERAVTYLEAKINLCAKLAAQFDRTAFYDEINEAKRNLDSLTFEEILRKDYKQWTENGLNLGTSAVVQPITFLKRKINKDDSSTDYKPLLEAAKEFARERDLCVFSIMTGYESSEGKFARDLAVLAVDEKGIAICKKFSDEPSKKLQLEEVDADEGDGHWFHVWKQGNLSCSRKQVAPLLREAMSA
ncbi:DHH phosphoesterase [Aureobasidium sp. EXF-3400]|nr:DHH phosphoesterase [Aureobasidium sp. EXF-12344]KAI4774169.1 DHH phosphoesterase [Aureobasidium sp. EXF-3400]